MSGTNALRPIIKRKKVIVAGGHHGGAWKVAYADFVTAMMAFFLLMWLLNATTEEQRLGIAAYFNPGIPAFMESGGGQGMFNGETAFAEQTEVQTGTGASSENPSDAQQAAGESGLNNDPAGDSDARFTEIESLFKGNSGESSVEDPLLAHVNTRVTDEGLIIEIFDLPESPLFVAGTEQPTAVAQELLTMVAGVLMMVTNDVALSGHLGRAPETAGQGDPFMLSGRRALRARIILQQAGMNAARFVRISGMSDRDPSLENGPDFRNRRLQVTLLRRPTRR